MLLREENGRLIALTQTAHSWASGQFARHWGNALFGSFSPHEHVCIAVELHDIGFAEWEQNPILNPATGQPFTFMDLPTAEHFRIWSHGVEQMKSFSLYTALLVSFHHTRLCERFHNPGPGEDATLREAFLTEQKQIQGKITEALQTDPATSTWIQPATLHRNRTLLSVWDFLSLNLLLNPHEITELEQVPAAEGSRSIRFHPDPSRSFTWHVEPWPFHTPHVQLSVEARLIPNQFTDQNQMRQSLLHTSPSYLHLTLRPQRTE